MYNRVMLWRELIVMGCYHRRWKLTPVEGGAQTHAEFELFVEIESVAPDWLVAVAMKRDLEAHFRIVKDRALAQMQQPGR